MTYSGAPAGIGRREFLAATTGATLAGLGGGDPVLAQVAPSAAPPASAPPGTVALERRGAVPLMGIDRPQAQNRIDPPIIIGLGKALYQLEHHDGLPFPLLSAVRAPLSL